VKWLKIVADECVEGYPDEQCPTLMVYVMKFTKYFNLLFIQIGRAHV
jgi:hypothetical protein